MSQQNQLEQQLAHGWQLFEAQTNTVGDVTARVEVAERRAAEAERALADANAQLEQLQRRLEQLQRQYGTMAPNGGAEAQRHETLQREHEDLLVLLAEQDNKLHAYRKRLRARGEPVSEDEEEECDNGDEDERRAASENGEGV